MKQLGLNAPVFVKKPKLTKRQKFLQEMDRVVPWALWVAKIAPHYPVAGRGRRPFPLETMLRIHLMQPWFGYSAPAMEEALHDVPRRREFAGLDAAEDARPDATTILQFRRLREAHALAQVLFDGTAALLLRQGTMVDATLIAAPPSTKNRDRQRDPERSSTKQGNHYSFGLKAHLGVDATAGLVHTVAVTTAKVTDGSLTDALLHGEEATVLGDRAYTRNDRNLEAERAGPDPVWGFPFKRKQGEAELSAEHALLNRMLAPLRAVVEHPFRIVKRQFGHVKVRYRGLSKNAQQLYLLFALGNLYQARSELMAAKGTGPSIVPETGVMGRTAPVAPSQPEQNQSILTHHSA